jgi:hypothetical protein
MNEFVDMTVRLDSDINRRPKVDLQVQAHPEGYKTIKLTLSNEQHLEIENIYISLNKSEIINLINCFNVLLTEPQP